MAGSGDAGAFVLYADWLAERGEDDRLFRDIAAGRLNRSIALVGVALALALGLTTRSGRAAG
jgi:hypothetical protein